MFFTYYLKWGISTVTSPISFRSRSKQQVLRVTEIILCKILHWWSSWNMFVLWKGHAFSVFQIKIFELLSITWGVFGKGGRKKRETILCLKQKEEETLLPFRVKLHCLAEVLRNRECSPLSQAGSVLHEHWTEFTAPTHPQGVVHQKEPEALWLCFHGNCLAHELASTGKIEPFNMIHFSLPQVFKNYHYCDDDQVTLILRQLPGFTEFFGPVLHSCIFNWEKQWSNALLLKRNNASKIPRKLGCIKNSKAILAENTWKYLERKELWSYFVFLMVTLPVQSLLYM